MTVLEARSSTPPTGGLPCIGKSHLFFGKHAERPQARVRREEKAKTVCINCPKIVDCRDYARSNNEFYGVWGGETESERYNSGFMKDVPRHIHRNYEAKKPDVHL